MNIFNEEISIDRCFALTPCVCGRQCTDFCMTTKDMPFEVCASQRCGCDADMETVVKMRTRVQQNLDTTFASSYKAKVNLEEMLTKDAITDYRQMKTGEKYLVTPWS